MFFYIQGPNKHDIYPVDKLIDPRIVNKVDTVVPSKALSAKDLQNLPTKQFGQGRTSAGASYKNIENALADKQVVFAYQIMTSPVNKLLASMSIDQALNIFQSKRLRHLPVVSASGKVNGMVSDRDVFSYMSGLGVQYKETASIRKKNDSVLKVMQSPVITAGLEADIRYIARLFVERHIGAMPIVLDGNLKGIITRSDILRALIKHYELELWV